MAGKKQSRRKAYEPYPKALVKTLPSPDPPLADADERAVLGSMMLWPESSHRGLGMLRAEDFWDSAHRSIFAAMESLSKERVFPNESQVRARLGARLEEAGGETYLMELLVEAPPPQTFRPRAELVREASALRQQMTAMMAYMQRPASEERLQLMRTLELTSLTSLEVVAMDELLREEIDVEWLIEPLIPLGGVTLLCAEPSMGKSWLALSLCHAIANGFEKWLGYFPIRARGGALFVDCEAGRAAQKQRLEALDAAAGVTTPVAVAGPVKPMPWDLEGETEGPAPVGLEPAERRPLGLVFDAPLTLGPGIGALEGQIWEWKAKLVVLDSLSQMLPGWANENDNSDMAECLNPVRGLARRTNSAILVPHHLRKRGGDPRADNRPESRIRGAGKILDLVDSCLVILGSPEGAKLVAHTKTRLSPTREPAFRLGFSAGPEGQGTRLVHEGAASSLEAEAGQWARALITDLVATGGQRRQEIIVHVKEAMQEERGETPGDRTIDRALSELVKEGVIRKEREGQRVRYVMPE